MTKTIGWKESWRTSWQHVHFRTQFIVTMVIGGTSSAMMANFLNYVEARPGVQLHDPILEQFAAVDLSWMIFSLIYLATATALVILLRNPQRLLLGLQSYVLLLWLRMLLMYLTPLEPPADIIALPDPFIEMVVGSKAVLMKDLFFSGHTSTCFLFFLLVRGRWIKGLFLLATLAVAMAVLWQHVHYSIDVAVAPLACFACYKLAQRLQYLSGATALTI